MTPLMQDLPERPLDIVGDVHGECSALEDLLQHLGYGPDGDHPDHRFLVFVGDLVDRGPDSPGVVRLVKRLRDAGNALCLVGNHELNLLLGKERAGNEWFFGEPQFLRGTEQAIPQVIADDAMREEMLLFLQTLPLAAQRDDLRVVHACWQAEAIASLEDENRSLVDLFYDSEKSITQACIRDGEKPDSIVADLARQNQNPVTVLTSGMEAPTAEPFRAGGQMRRVERVAWWRSYRDQVPVVFGHYWRAMDPENRAVKRGPYLFQEQAFQAPLGPLANAYCVDYSIGYRNVERAKEEVGTRSTALMALRVPEFELLADDGSRYSADAR
ncbi:MAG: metallophosphoesterase [Planctomycetota bacterium]